MSIGNTLPQSRTKFVLLLIGLGMVVAALPGLIRADSVQARPSNLQYELDPEGIRISWDAPAIDSASVSGYRIFRRVPTRGQAQLSVLVADTGNTDTSYLDTTANEVGQRYVYRVRAMRGGQQGGRSPYIRIDLDAPLPVLQQSVTPQADPPPPPTIVPSDPDEPLQTLAQQVVDPDDELDVDRRPPTPHSMEAEYDPDRIVLTWQHPSDKSDVVSYELVETIFDFDPPNPMLDENDDVIPARESRTLSLSSSATSWTNNSPILNRTYSYALRSVNELDNASGSLTSARINFKPSRSYTFAGSTTDGELSLRNVRVDIWRSGDYTITVKASDDGGDAPDDATYSIYQIGTVEYLMNTDTNMREFKYESFSTPQYMSNQQDRSVPGLGNTVVIEGTLSHLTSNSIISMWRYILQVDDPGVSPATTKIAFSMSLQ